MLIEEEIRTFKIGDSITGANKANILLPSFVCFVEKFTGVDANDCDCGFYYQILTRSQFTINKDDESGITWDGCLVVEVNDKSYNLRNAKALLIEIIKP